jgi:hypothetical protein
MPLNAYRSLLPRRTVMQSTFDQSYYPSRSRTHPNPSEPSRALSTRQSLLKATLPSVDHSRRLCVGQVVVLSSPSGCVPSPWRVRGNPSDALIVDLQSSLNDLQTNALPFVALSLLFGLRNNRTYSWRAT